jgi:glutathione S-transferase
MRVYHRPGAGRPIRVLWALEEAGLDYELVVLSSEEAKAEHRSRHPLGRVPVLEGDDGNTVFESSAICLHVAELAPAAELIAPSGTLERALAYQWIFFAMTEIEPPALEVYRARQAEAGDTEAAERRVQRALAAVDAALTDRDYILGERFSVADVVLGEVTGMTGRLGLGLAEPGPNLRAYLARLAERPARQRATAKIAAVS